MSQVWVIKQDHRRMGEPCWNDPDVDYSWWCWVGSSPAHPLGWRGPSNPTYTVESVHAGDLIVVYDLREEAVHEAHVALGVTEERTWHDYVDQRDKTSRGVLMVPVAGYPVTVEGEDLRAIKASGQNTLNSVRWDFGEPLWRMIVAEAARDAREDRLIGERRVV